MKDNLMDELDAQLADIFAEADFSDVEDLTVLSNDELMERVYSLTDALKARREALHPTTQEARDMHSQRNACQVELRNRNVLPK